MMRRIALVSLALVFVLAMVSVASAKSNITDTFKKGSLLVFPKIVAYGSEDTVVMIGNDNTVAVNLKCYWMDNNQTVEDFEFTMSPNQVIYFEAHRGRGDMIDVPPFIGVGELKCWAVDAAGAKPIKFNHLYGNALIYNDDSRAVLYNAYSFAAPGDPSTLSTPYALPLDGAVYDACPQYLVSNFIASDFGSSGFLPAGYERPDLTLVPCKQDLRQDRTPTCTKAKFDVWSENEVKFTGAYQCFKCWYEGFLDEIGSTNTTTPQNGYSYDTTQKGNGFGWDKFTEWALGTETGRFRVVGIPSTVCKYRAPWDVCNGKTVATPLLGLLLYASHPGSLQDYNNAKIVDAIAGTTPFGAGSDPTGMIWWDPQPSVIPEAPAN